ncbi:peptidoglycan-binding domain-containing protein [Patulibacter sp.]|uniref:peptidoglycan-binding domain-containing protein n=1 Tax=Patulibacter sp. TaxID=1912859 RepID=UPI00271B6CFF|nr:peptidoglycan-binding domain-containing protein [Patulibacter sp.]MDO9410689.1 peptidoglycan-binding domain-containing protein [Patulibacter sp.]
MSTLAHPAHLLRPRRRPAPGLLALALLPGAASAVDAVPAIDARAAQARLVDLGLLRPSAATGTWNPSTAEAVRRFQLDRGLEPSGVAGAATARRLRDA